MLYAAVNTFHANTAGVMWLTEKHSAEEYLVLFMFLKRLSYNEMSPRSFRGVLEDLENLGIYEEKVRECLDSICSSGVMFRIPDMDIYFVNPSYFWKGSKYEHFASERMYDNIIRSPYAGEWSGEYGGYTVGFSLQRPNKK